LVQNLLNNWFRKKNKIQTFYDKEGGYDDGYKILYKQVEKQKRKTMKDNCLEPEEFEKPIKK